jgi:hypothetical protein
MIEPQQVPNPKPSLKDRHTNLGLSHQVIFELFT